MDPLVSAIIEQIETGAGEFNSLALSLFDRQYRLNEPYRRYCDAVARTPETVEAWEDVPAVPALAFKRHELSCVGSEQVELEFHSSGTTEGAPSRHRLDGAARRLYEVSLLNGFLRLGLRGAPPLPIWSLAPPFEQAPNSSLSYMVRTLISDLPVEGHRYLTPAELEGAMAELRGPVVLFGTALAWLDYFEHSSRAFALPEGTVVMETGGMKGRTVSVERATLYGWFTERLGVPPSHCRAEYGMSELSSQCYDLNETGLKGPVAWLKARVVDPLTEEEVGVGQIGTVRFFDLANFNSVAAVQTEDLAERREVGFVLLGRAAGAEIRGCSLSAEELMRRR